MTDHCPLCMGDRAPPFHEDARRNYLRCERCALVFVPARFRLSRDEERAEYLRHENDVDDPGYRRFLSRLADPLIQRLPPASQGLDFGCGPAPALATMLEEQGHKVALYDSFFAPETTALQQRYDFVTATEVVEHLHDPATELQRLWSRINEGGWLGVMTKLVRDRDAFAHWHYIRDPTHVCFFSRETWRWWAAQQGGTLEFVADDVMLLQKRAASPTSWP